MISKLPTAEIRPQEQMLFRVRERQQQNDEKAAKDKNARGRPDDEQECQGNESKKHKQQEKQDTLTLYLKPKSSERYEDKRPVIPSGVPNPQKQGADEDQQNLTRANFRAMLKRKVVEQSARATKRKKKPEFEAPKHESKNSQEGHLQHNQRVGNDCQENQLHAKDVNQNPKGRANDEQEPFFNATYAHDPQLPGAKGQTELIKARIEKRGRADASVYEAEAGPPDKRHAMNAIIKKQASKRANQKDELNAITRLVRAKKV